MRMQPTHEKQHTLWKRWMEMREELGASDTLLRELAAEYFTELARLAQPFRALPPGRCVPWGSVTGSSPDVYPIARSVYLVLYHFAALFCLLVLPKGHQHLEVDTVRRIMQAIHLFKNQANTLHLFEIMFQHFFSICWIQQTDSVIGKTATNLELRWRYSDTPAT